MYISPVAPLTFRPREPKRPKEQLSEGNVTTTPSVSRQKRCAKCGKKKDHNDFPKHSTSSDGRASYCRACKNGLAKERRFKDPIARITHYTVTRIKNEWPKDKVPDDIHTNLEGYLGYKLSQLKKALREDAKARYDKSLTSCFKDGYHLDHIRPHRLFNAVEVGDEEFRACWAISNLRLIPAAENLAKGGKEDFYTQQGTSESAVNGTCVDFYDTDEDDEEDEE